MKRNLKIVDANKFEALGLTQLFPKTWKILLYGMDGKLHVMLEKL